MNERGTVGADEKLIELSRELRSGLDPVVKAIAGPATRPALLVRRLGIDRSLAGRITRALRTEDDLELLHLLPAPTGLRIFLEAASESGIGPDLVDPAEEAVDLFHARIDETPGGRATLIAGISAHSEQARERNERSAKQAVHKAMSYLLGVQCDYISSGFLLCPADDGATVDGVDLNLKVSIRRLRPTAPVGLFGYKARPADEEGRASVSTLDGAVAEGAEEFLLPEYCSESLPSLESFRDRDEAIFALAEDGPPPDAPITLALGMIFHGAFRRYRAPGQDPDFRTYSVPFPCRTLVRDVFIHRDLYGDSVPEVTQYIPRMMRPETVRYRGVRGMLDSVDMAAPVQELGTGLDRTTVKEIPSHRPLLEHGFARAGWDPGEFRGYRVKVTYPVPFLYMSWWFDQPEAPRD